MRLGDAWWDDGPVPAYIPLPPVPPYTSLLEDEPMIGQDHEVAWYDVEPLPFPEEPGANFAITLPPIVAYEQPAEDIRTGFETFVPGEEWSVPEVTASAVSHSVSDVLRSMPYAISGPEEDALVAAAQGAIADSAATGRPLADTLGQWGTTLSDTLRSMLPAVINRALGFQQQAPAAAVAARPPATAGLDWKTIGLVGLGVVAVASMAGRKAAYARAPMRRAAPRVQRAPRRPRRR